MIAVFKMCHARCVMKVSIPSLPTKHHVCFFGSPCTFSEEPVLSARSWKTNMAGFKVAKSARDQLTSRKYGPQRQRVESGPCHLPFEYLKLSWCSEKYSAFEAETDLIVIILGISWDLGAGESVQGPRLTRKDSTLILYNFIVSPWQFNVLLHADFSKALLLSVAWRSRSDVSQSLTWLCLYYSVRSATSR